MNGSNKDREAQQILDWLTGSLGKRLDENERHVWLATLAEMDASRAMEVALQFGKGGERFPSIPEFRRAMRPVVPGDDQIWRDLPPERIHDIPEWCHVWFWLRTEKDDWRPFSQFYPRPEGAMADAEYQEVRQQWVAAGSPRLGSAQDLLNSLKKL